MNYSQCIEEIVRNKCELVIGPAKTFDDIKISLSSNPDKHPRYISERFISRRAYILGRMDIVEFTLARMIEGMKKYVH